VKSYEDYMPADRGTVMRIGEVPYLESMLRDILVELEDSHNRDMRLAELLRLMSSVTDTIIERQDSFDARLVKLEEARKP